MKRSQDRSCLSAVNLHACVLTLTHRLVPVVNVCPRFGALFDHRCCACVRAYVLVCVRACVCVCEFSQESNSVQTLQKMNVLRMTL